MQSHDRPVFGSASFQKAVWLLLAVGLNTLELFVPRIPLLPWLKPGLANSITIIWIIRFGTADAILYTMLRTWIGSFYFGFSLVSLSLSLSGGLSATLAMGLAWDLLGRRGLIGSIGLAVLGAFMHNAGQLAAVYLVLTRNSALLYQIPFMGLAALLFGGFTGLLTPVFWKALAEPAVAPSPRIRAIPITHTFPSLPHAIAISSLLGGSFVLVAVNDIPVLCITAAAASVLTWLVCSRKILVLVYPLRFWYLFLFIGTVFLCFTFGTRIPGVPLVSYEGIRSAAAQSLRLWVWLEASLLLNRLGCNGLLFAAMRRIFPRNGETLLAGLLALECFPEVLRFVKSREALNQLPWSRPLEALALFVARIQRFVPDMLLRENSRSNPERDPDNFEKPGG